MRRSTLAQQVRSSAIASSAISATATVASNRSSFVLTRRYCTRNFRQISGSGKRFLHHIRFRQYR